MDVAATTPPVIPAMNKADSAGEHAEAGAKRQLDEDTVHAAPNPAKRRIQPTPVPVASMEPPPSASASASASATGATATDESEPPPSRPVPDDDDDAELDPEQLRRLKALSEDEQQALIDRFFMAKQSYDDAVAMLENGADPSRHLGTSGFGVTPERLAAERDLLAELVASRQAEGLSTDYGAGGDGDDDFALATEDAMADLDESLEARLAEAEAEWLPRRLRRGRGRRVLRGAPREEVRRALPARRA